MRPLLAHLLGILALSFTFFLSVNTPLAAQGEPDSGLQLLQEFMSEKATDDLPQMRKRKSVRALVTFSKTDFFFTMGQPMGIQAELLRQYEKFLNKGITKKELRMHVFYIPVPFNRLIPMLLEGKGDIAAAFLTITPEREKKVAFATGRRLKVDEIVVASKKVKGLNTVEDLSGRAVYVLRSSSYVEHLQTLNDRLRSRGKAPVKIKEADSNLLTEDILEMVNAGVVDITVADDFKAKVWAKVLPNLVLRKDLKVHSEGIVGWAVRKNNPELLKSLEATAQHVKKGTKLGNIFFKRYYQNTRWIKNPMQDEERKKFENYVSLFRKYGDTYGFDYIAIAAQAYQESGLDPNRRSPVGAVGIMQVLPSTAADPNVGIPNVEELENNIHAGVKYLAFLRDNYFKDPGISNEDRFAFSWAAYNAGPAKVRKMRKKAKAMGLDPNKWFQNVEHAALRMVGQETVRYVANIYKYYIAYSLAAQQRQKK